MSTHKRRGRVPRNEIGNRYGRLTVLRYYGTSPVGSVYVCRCDCGQEIAVRAMSLRSGKTRSCGCLKDMSREERARLGFAPRGKEREIRC